MIEPRNRYVAEAETVHMVERNMCDAVMRGIVVPPGSKSTSRANGSRRKLGGLVSGRYYGGVFEQQSRLGGPGTRRTGGDRRQALPEIMRWRPSLVPRTEAPLGKGREKDGCKS